MICQRPIWIRETSDRKGQYVPCGRCYDCLQKKRAIWTFRIMQESKRAESSYFITLTYDEENIPIADIYGYQVGTLAKIDLTNFIKRLRQNILKYAPEYDSRWFNISYSTNNSGSISKRVNSKIRYFACGEYGSKGDRPHYHIIIWNFPDYFVDLDRIHKEIYSDLIDKVWNKGFTTISEVNQARAHYVAKYTLDPLVSWSKEYDYKEKPYATMSRKPGVGNCYVNDKTIKHYQRIDGAFALQEGYKLPIGRYLKEKLYDDYTVEERFEKKINIQKYLENTEVVLTDDQINKREKYNDMKVKNTIKRNKL